MSDNSSPKNSWVSIAAVIGGFAIFVLILIVAYVPKKAEPLPEGVKTPAQRYEILTEHRAKEAKAAGSYAWIDQGKGVVQLPIDRAVELTIQELNAGKK